MSQEEKDGLKRTYRTVYLVWLAMLGALCIYVAFGLLFGDQFDVDLQQSPSVLETVRSLFFVVSGFQFILAFTLRRMYLSRRGQTSGLRGVSVESIQRMQRFQTIVIVSLALAEAPGLLGLLYLMLSNDSDSFLILVALSAVGMLLLRPKRNELDQFVTRGRLVS
jgi:F0F1-type ATP synthase membrane subunit c/vacuolar-type H+-ATPase subunit K